MSEIKDICDNCEIRRNKTKEGKTCNIEQVVFNFLADATTADKLPLDLELAITKCPKFKPLKSE